MAVEELIDLGVEGICINFMFSFRNPAHELEVRDIAEEIIARRGVNIPLFLSSDYYPVRGDFPRLNTLVIEASAAEPSRNNCAALISL